MASPALSKFIHQGAGPGGHAEEHTEDRNQLNLLRCPALNQLRLTSLEGEQPCTDSS